MISLKSVFLFCFPGQQTQHLLFSSKKVSCLPASVLTFSDSCFFNNACFLPFLSHVWKIKMETPLICELYSPLVVRSQGSTFLILKIGSKSSAREAFPSLLFAAPQSLHCASDQFRLSSICKFLLSPPRQLASSFPWCFVNPVVLVHFISFSSTLAWKIPWTEGTGGLQSMGSLGVRHD